MDGNTDISSRRSTGGSLMWRTTIGESPEQRNFFLLNRSATLPRPKPRRPMPDSTDHF